MQIVMLFFVAFLLHHGVGCRDGVCTIGRKALVVMPTRR